MNDSTEFRENHTDATPEELAVLRAIIRSQKPRAELPWQGSTDPIIMALGH